MYCHTCGYTVDSTDKQCVHCGSSRSRTPVVVPDGGRENPDETDTDATEEATGTPGETPPGNDTPPQDQRGGSPPEQPFQGDERTPAGRQGQPPEGGQPEGQQGPPPGQQRPPRGEQGQQPQGGQPQRRGQPQSGHGPPGQPPGPGQPAGNGGDDDGMLDKLGRREFIGLGAGAALAGGGYWLFLRGPSGVKGVVNDYYNALDSTDLNTLQSLVHPDSAEAEQMAEADDFEDYFGEDITEYFENVSFSVEGLYELSVEEDEEEWFLQEYDSDEHDVEIVYEVLAILDVDESAVDEDDRYYDERTRLVQESHQVVEDSNSDYYLW